MEKDPRPEKVAVVAEVKQKFEEADAVVLTEYRGLNVSEMAELRTAMYAAGGEYKIYKNSLVKFATNDLGLELDDQLVGPTAIAFTSTRPDGSAGDPVTIAKALSEFAKTNPKLVIKGGVLGDELLSGEQVGQLAKIAPREELLARLAGGMAAPMQQLASLLGTLPRNMAYAIKGLIDMGGAPGAPADTVPAEATETIEDNEANEEAAAASSDESAEGGKETEEE